LENLKKVDPQGQAEVVVLQQVLERLGTAVPKLGQRLVEGEARACLGEVVARGLPVLQSWQEELEQPGANSAEIRARLNTALEDLRHLWSDPEGQWSELDIAPGIARAWRLATLGLPAEIERHLEVKPLPPVWGSAAELSLAELYLLTFAVDLLDSTGELGLKAEPTPAGGVRLTVSFSGESRTPAECQAWLNPFAAPEGIQGSLGPALAAAIAARHRGSLRVAPREEGGAAFSLELPPLSTARESHGSFI
ncbi:MAG TPA: hypothetical protein VE082_03095, partial [Desulfobaccales bacterium]|nr:hypothetical protein [Desulfobaccales bacterium]